MDSVNGAQTFEYQATDDTAPKHELFIKLIGGLELSRPDGSIIRLRSRKQKLLIAILAFRRGKPMDRAAAASIVWGRHAPSNALTSLRQALASLREAFSGVAGDVLIATRRSLRFDSRLVRTELDPIFEAESLGTIGRELVSRVCRNGVLEDVQLNEAKIQRWIEAARADLRQHLAMLLQAALDPRQEDAISHDDRRWISRELEMLDRWHEKSVPKYLCDNCRRSWVSNAHVPRARRA